MTDPQIINARGRHAADLPPQGDLPPHEPIPQLLTDHHTAPNPTQPTTTPRRRRNTPIAASDSRTRCALGAALIAGALGLLALVAVLADRGHHHPARPPASPTAAVDRSSFSSTLPQLGGGSVPVPPLRLVIAVPSRLRHRLRRQLPTLHRWLEHNEQPASTVQVLSKGAVSTITARRPIGALPRLGPSRPTTDGHVLAALQRRGHPRTVSLFISIERAAPTVPRGVVVGRIRVSKAPMTPTADLTSLAVRDGLAASVALQVARATGQSLAARPQLRRNTG